MSISTTNECGSANKSVRYLSRPVIVLALLAACHFLVDIVAGTTNPIWPTLESHLQLAEGGLLWVYVVWSVSTSFSQLFFGLWADSHHSRWLIWAGPLVGILCISSLGLASTSLPLACLFAFGGLGIAAFHPEAAATAGALLPGNRSRAMAIFALCGYLGQAVGPYYSGLITEQLGPRGLLWGMAWGLPALFLLTLGLRQVPADIAPTQSTHSERFNTREKFPLIGLLLTIGALRILPALGVPLALAYLLKSTDASNVVIGAVQSSFMAGIGFGAMACAIFVRRTWERHVLWIFPLCATPLLAMIGIAEGWTQVGLVGTCGLLLGITMPVYISYGQQLLPHGQRVASAITMGVSWGIGGAIVACAMSFCLKNDSLPWIFGFFSLSSFGSSLFCCLLPVPDSPVSDSPVL